jgi:hypothetical protein
VVLPAEKMGRAATGHDNRAAPRATTHALGK